MTGYPGVMHQPLLYPNGQAFLDAPNKRIALVAMSGLGKTYTSNRLRDAGNWYHYSVDYRIGTRYMGEHIVDNFKREAMKIPLLRELLMDDAIYIGNNITFENLAPLSTYLGKPGDPALGGIPFGEYMTRQGQHRDAEISATRDTVAFIDKATGIYGYDNFICDTSGSICEVVEPSDPQDPVLRAMAAHTLIILIEGSDSHIDTLCDRFDKSPKPMYSREKSMTERWQAYLSETGLAEGNVDPDAFIRWSYRKIIEDRVPLYRGIAQNWGITVPADALVSAEGEAGIMDLIAASIDGRP